MRYTDWLIVCWLLYATLGPDRMAVPWLAWLLTAALTAKVWTDRSERL